MMALKPKTSSQALISSSFATFIFFQHESSERGRDKKLEVSSAMFKCHVAFLLVGAYLFFNDKTVSQAILCHKTVTKAFFNHLNNGLFEATITEIATTG